MSDIQKYVDHIQKEIEDLYDADYTPEERDALEAAGEPFDFNYYFDDALDIEFIISSSGDFRGCRIAVTLGGPNVWVDTTAGEVRGAWGTDSATARIRCDVCDAINNQFEDYYNAVAIYR